MFPPLLRQPQILRESLSICFFFQELAHTSGYFWFSLLSPRKLAVIPGSTRVHTAVAVCAFADHEHREFIDEHRVKRAQKIADLYDLHQAAACTQPISVHIHPLPCARPFFFMSADLAGQPEMTVACRVYTIAATTNGAVAIPFAEPTRGRPPCLRRRNAITDCADGQDLARINISVFSEMANQAIWLVSTRQKGLLALVPRTRVGMRWTRTCLRRVHGKRRRSPCGSGRPELALSRAYNFRARRTVARSPFHREKRDYKP